MFIKASHEANMSKEVNFGKIACRSPHRQLRFHSTLPPFSLIFLERRAVNKSVKYDLPPCYQNISTVQTIWLIAIQSQETINQMFCVPNEYFRNCTKMYSNYSPFFQFSLQMAPRSIIHLVCFCKCQIFTKKYQPQVVKLIQLHAY